MLVFAVVDPAELRWFGAAPVELSSHAVYTLAFLVFWGVTALASSLALLLALVGLLSLTFMLARMLGMDMAL